MENNKKQEAIEKIYKLWVHDILKDAYENRGMSRLTVIEVAYLVAEAKEIKRTNTKRIIPKKWENNPWDGYGIYSSVHTALKSLVDDGRVREEIITPKRKKKTEEKRKTYAYTYNDIGYIRKIKEEEIRDSVELSSPETFNISKNTIAIKAYCEMTEEQLEMFKEFVGVDNCFLVTIVYGAIILMIKGREEELKNISNAVSTMVKSVYEYQQKYKSFVKREKLIEKGKEDKRKNNGRKPRKNSKENSAETKR